MRELLEPLGCRADKTVVDDYLREVRPLFAAPRRTFQRTVYRPGEVCQFDVWRPRSAVPVGHGLTRRGWVVVACLGYSRAGAGVLVFSTQTEDLLAGIAGCVQRLGALPKTLVWDRQAGNHGHAGRPLEAFAAFCGQLKVAWRFCEPDDPQANGRGRAPAGRGADQLRTGPRVRQRVGLPRPARRLVRSGQRAPAQDAARAPDRPPARRARAHDGAAARVARHDAALGHARAPDPYLRIDTNDNSLDPRLVGQRVEIRVAQRQVSAVALDTGELAARHARVFARHRTITALDHARALRDGRRPPEETAVEVRPLARYDALIA